ncbi:hypothetical protein Acr_10g0007120 [Actinidia rufa]|uniref:Transposase (putative) gypsy type domain-containing protein n=1 Tax=Actinidia rufa TaxID=165716 RepID=A0A7J0FBR6_9ERIC|nr:hypothetical protein Acr_10g0007120 [Actinidia rufa]
MMDKVNQLPSPSPPPPEDSTLRAETSNHGKDSEMITYTPFEKEFNVMTQDNLDRLRETYSFLVGIQARIPNEGETILSTRPSEIAFYEAAFSTGLRLPIHPTIRRILNFYNIYPAQLSPNAWRSVVCVLMIWQFYKRAMSLNKFRCLYSLFKSPKSDLGWLYFKARSRKNLFKASNVKGWKRRFFFISGDDWKLFPNLAWDEGVPWVPRTWGTQDKRCKKLPILTDIKDWRTRRVFKKIGPGGYFNVPVVLNSKTFQKYFAFDRERMSSRGEDNAEGKSADGAIVFYVTRVRLTIPKMNNPKAKGLPSFLNWEPRSLNLSSSSSLEAMSESWLPSKLRSDGMSKRISLKKFAQKVGGGQGHELGDKIHSCHKECGHQREVPKGKGEGGQTLPRLSGHEVLPHLSQVVVLGSVLAVQSRLEGLMADLGEREKKAAEELKEKFDAVVRLEEEVAELKKNEVLAKKKDFDYKRQLAHHHPNLGIDLDNMGLDHDLLEEEEEEEKGEDNEE